MSAKKTNVSESRNSGSLASGSPSEQFEDRTGSPDQSKPAMSGGLYLVATPIGNARDITLRALDILAAADVIACEDTRVTAKLLSIHGVAAQKTISYHEHNAEKVRPHLMERLKSGEIVAIVSDAGTPLINDPGFRLVSACREEQIPVHAAPGASAVTTALVLAGLPTDRFMYCGFPPPKSGKRRTWLGGVSTTPSTLVFLESPKRLAASLADMSEIFGDRPAAVCREMTKKFEETRTGSLAKLAAHYVEADPPRGEITVVIGPPGEDTAPDATAVKDRLRDALQTESVREASSRIAAETGLPRRDVYSLALKLKNGDSGET